ncbi:hypothetical protein [Rhizobium leucaenae]|uniref:hypothetical protein n=1 Tax=Rhizobium leucaenae TaxID=29450 RepID=UPI001606FC1A|nr:hypothetical protein [Rhizobium leucaenae]MBB6304052.1 hypothetical protein [Rhizobium leucaenae]
MPRNGSGVYSKPAGTTAQPNTTIESAKYNQTVDDLVADANVPRPMVAGGHGAATVAGAQTNLSVDNKIVYTAKSGAYTALPADNNGVLRFTASATLTLTAAASLAANWHVIVIADGGAVTVDPNASETINGATTLLLQDGQAAFIVCDGSAFYVRVIDNKTLYSATGSNYTAVSADNKGIKRFTASATLALTAAATLGAGWHMTVVADGGVVTIDPNASETINGVLTVTVPNGSSVTIVCDGTSFYSYVKAAAWEAIGDYTLSAASLLDVTNLAAYRKLRITGVLTMSAASNVLLRFSTDNGSTFDSTAGNYPEQALYAVGSTVTGVSSSIGGAALFPATPDANFITSVNTTIEAFNKASRTTLSSKGSVTGSGLLVAGIIDSQYLVTAPRNAIRILPISGTMTGSLYVEGVRG